MRITLASLFGTPRPDAGPVIKYERVGGFAGFPSGHVTTAGVVLGYVALRTRFPLWLALVALFGVALARLYLGVHFLVDVLGALVVAALLLAGWLRLWPRIEPWARQRGFRTWAVVAALVAVGALATPFFYLGDSPIRWNAAAMALGLAIALPLEYRYVRYRPAATGWGRRLGVLALGLAGILPPLLIDRFSGEASVGLGAAMALFASVWALLVAPAFFSLLGWSEAEEPRRETAVRTVAVPAAWALGALALVGIYGMGIEPRFLLDVQEETAPVAGLPGAWEGRRLAVLGDMQVGMWWGNGDLAAQAVRTAVAARPAAILMTGDFLYKVGRDPSSELEELARILRPIQGSGIPALAVLGNHDWGLLAREDTPDRETVVRLRDLLAGLGIRLLENEAVALRLGGEALWVAGIGSRWAGLDDAARALAGVPGDAPRVALMHHPDSFLELGAGQAPLAVAGHTHGGQVRLPGTPGWSWLTFRSDEEAHADGWIVDGFGRPGNRLYVNRGIGMSYLPLRINARPELTLFTVSRAPAESAPAGGGVSRAP